MRFIVLLGVVSLFADMTYEAARSITGPYLALLGAAKVVRSAAPLLTSFGRNLFHSGTVQPGVAGILALIDLPVILAIPTQFVGLLAAGLEDAVAFVSQHRIARRACHLFTSEHAGHVHAVAKTLIAVQMLVERAAPTGIVV